MVPCDSFLSQKQHFFQPKSDAVHRISVEGRTFQPVHRILVERSISVEGRTFQPKSDAVHRICVESPAFQPKSDAVHRILVEKNVVFAIKNYRMGP